MSLMRDAVNCLVISIVLFITPSPCFIVKIRDSSEDPAGKEIFLNKANQAFDRLSECSHNRSYPHTFFIRTFGCNAYWMELIRFKCADK